MSERFNSLGSTVIGLSVLSMGCGFVLDEGEHDTDQGSTGGMEQTEGDSADGASSMAPTTGVDSGDDSGDATDSGEDDGTSTGEMVEPYETDIEWTPCSVQTGGGGGQAQCADIELPVDWSDPWGETLTVFVKRIGNPDGNKQLWMLMGGPGAAGSGYEGTAQSFVDADEELVVYLPDHRGVGRSSRLGCPAQEAPGSDQGLGITAAEWPACIDAVRDAWGEGLDHFSTSEAARDLGWLVEELRGEQAVHVFGGSYGTYWGHRYLQIYPEQPDSLTLLGIAPPEFDFTQFTEAYDGVGRRFMDRCSEDALCASKLGPDAQGAMEQIMDQVDAGLCPEALAMGLDRETLKVFFSAQLSWAWSERALIPAVLYRIARCNAEDVAALAGAAPQMMDPLGGLLNDPLFSRVLNNHVSISEMWHPPIPTVEQAQQAAADALFGLGSTEGRVVLADEWPTYAPDEYALEYAESDVPMLMLVGQFDPNSPPELGAEFAEHFTGEDQHFFEIPDGSHGWDSPTTEGYGCAINMFFNFVQDPQQPLLDCMGDVTPMDFGGRPGLSQSFFGTMDLYEN